MTTAKILADSINGTGSRLTTFEIEVPKYMVAQLNTHRAISRNYESSRAKPFWRVLEQVCTDPYIPKRFGKPSRGMQPAGYYEFDYAQVRAWRAGVNSAVEVAITLGYSETGELGDLSEEAYDATMMMLLDYEVGLPIDFSWFKANPPLVAKETLNRLLEPFMKVKGVISATDWDNFIHLRANSDAQDDINELAQQIKRLLADSDPTFVAVGEWHLPNLGADKDEVVENIARVSYGNHRSPSSRPEGTLYRDLQDGGHWSPFEHVAMVLGNGKSNFDSSWTQLRQLLGGN